MEQHDKWLDQNDPHHAPDNQCLQNMTSGLGFRKCENWPQSPPPICPTGILVRQSARVRNRISLFHSG
jgi:hypothetical protein